MTETNTANTTTPTPAQAQIAWIIATIVVFAWGINFVLAKHALNQFDIGPFNFFRFAGMALCGWLVLLLIGGVRPVDPVDRRRLVMVAVVGFCGYVFGFSVGLNLTSAFSASLLLALVPLWLVIFVSIIERRRPSGASLAALAVALAGTVVFVASRTSGSLGWGDLISLFVAACYASFLLLNRPLVDRYPPFHAHHLRCNAGRSPDTSFHRPYIGRSGLDYGHRLGLDCHGLGHHRACIRSLVGLELGSATTCIDPDCADALPRTDHQRGRRVGIPR